MLPALLLTLATAIYIGVLLLIAAGLYKDPVLRHFERYAERDDSFYLLPPLLLGLGLFAISGGFLFSASIAPRYPPLILGIIFLALAFLAREHTQVMSAYPQIFLAYPRWYAELRERTTREERRHIAYMWLALPGAARLHFNGSDYHFLIWADHVILATVTQTVEDQEAKGEEKTYLPDLHGRFG
jgi:hypothetical protein